MTAATYTWQRSGYGGPEDCFIDTPAGNRWMIRKTKFRAGKCYMLKLNGAKVAMHDTIDEAKAEAESRAAQTDDGEP